MKTTKKGFSTTREYKTLMAQWEKYRGQIVMVINNEVFATKSASRVSKMTDAIEEKFHKRPLITYVPKEGTLILFA